MSIGKKLLTLRRCALQPNSPLAANLISPAPTSNTASTFFKNTSPNTASPPPTFCAALKQIPASPVPSIIQRINIEQLAANIDTKFRRHHAVVYHIQPRTGIECGRGVEERIYNDGNAIRQVDERRAAINNHPDWAAYVFVACCRSCLCWCI